jgi:hypothetical protein
MRYHWFRSRGLFTGSGVVEAGCKTIVGQRLKQSGMHWTIAGADPIITLRCAEASSQWETVCRNRHNQTGAARPARTRRRSSAPYKIDAHPHRTAST